MDTLEGLWYRFIRLVLFDQPSFYISNSGRKYVSNCSFVVPGEVWTRGFGLEMTDLGYKAEISKINQLKRIYLNEEGIQAAREKLISRVKSKKEFTSVMVPTINNKKDSRSQGYCMNTIVVTHLPKSKHYESMTNVDIFYRVTEVTQKFGADLIFLSKVVIPQIVPIGLKINEVKFHFTNAYFSPLFLPVLYHFVDPADFMEDVELMAERTDRGHSIFNSCLRAAALPFIQKDPEHYKYRTRRLMHHLALRALEEKRISPTKLMNYVSSNQDLKRYVEKMGHEDTEEEDDE